MSISAKFMKLLARLGISVALLAAFGITFAQLSLAPTAIELTPADEDGIVLSPGEDGMWDAVSVRFPSVILKDGTYHMFYGSFQDQQSPVAIGYATSEDGLNWTKYEGNPIFEADGTGFDAFGVTRPVVVAEDNGTWTLYYNAIDAAGQVFGSAIGRATAYSPTGSWTRLDEPILESGGARDWDIGFLFPDSVVYANDQWMLYYSASRRIGLATSEDGINWTKYNDPETSGSQSNSDAVFPTNLGTTWDSSLSWAGNVRVIDGGFEMFYYGNRSNTEQTSLGYAYSADGITWTRYENNPILPPVGSGNVFFPSVVVDDAGVYHVYYARIPQPGAFTQIAVSTGSITRNE